MKPIRLGEFRVGITTSYKEWFDSFEQRLDGTNRIFDKDCERFAIKQAAYMFFPDTVIGYSVYRARRIIVKDVKYLEQFSDSGPLYEIYKVMIDDLDAGKTEERVYYDDSFRKNFGLWYPQKEQLILRIGVEE